jgi:hypothetical protein
MRFLNFAVGPEDHGAPGRHEYEKDLAALKACLDNANAGDIATQLYAGKVPDPAELKNAAVRSTPSPYDPLHTARLKQIDAPANPILRGVEPWNNNREVLRNAIMWAAGLEVPAGGVQCK